MTHAADLAALSPVPGSRTARGDLTREAIIENAEKMIADHGVEGVSLRQIRVAIGSNNSNLVSYHFGSKESLVEAIYLQREARIEEMRKGLLADLLAREQGGDVAVLLNAMFLPFFELTAENGEHVYAAFISSISRSNWSHWISRSTQGLFSAGFSISKLMEAAIAPEIRASLRQRTVIAFAMIAVALQVCDREHADDPAAARRLFDSAIRMAASAITTP
jgi:AcrR family transcriptional regulator